MAILVYQIGIFIAIQIAAMFGKSSRNTAIILISIFTLLQVYTLKLLILQFITILIAYKFASRRSKFLLNNAILDDASDINKEGIQSDVESLFYGYQKGWEEKNPDKSYIDYIAYLEGRPSYDNTLYIKWRMSNPKANMNDYVKFLENKKYNRSI